MPKISVIMSVYKEPIEWMKLAIDSILNQTFQDFEFIIVNDNPTRVENKEVLEDYCNIDHRVVVISNEVNIGLTKSLNKALTISEGEFIARMDADDISMPNRLENQLSYMESHPSIVACGSYIKVINEKGDFVGNRKVLTSPIEIRSTLIFNAPIVHPASMFRRIVNDRVVRYNERRKYSQDYALWVEFSRYNDITNIPSYLLFYRESVNQISTKNHFEQQECAILNSEEAISALGIVVSEQDKSVILGLTRVDNYCVSPTVIEQAILNLKANNIENNRIDVNKMVSSLVLIYCNYLPKHYSFCFCVNRFVQLSYRLSHFSIYNLLSLIKKLILR